MSQKDNTNTEKASTGQVKEIKISQIIALQVFFFIYNTLILNSVFCLCLVSLVFAILTIKYV